MAPVGRDNSLTIGHLAERTGPSAPACRPRRCAAGSRATVQRPIRLVGGRRRYVDQDVAAVGGGTWPRR